MKNYKNILIGVLFLLVIGMGFKIHNLKNSSTFIGLLEEVTPNPHTQGVTLNLKLPEKNGELPNQVSHILGLTEKEYETFQEQLTLQTMLKITVKGDGTTTTSYPGSIRGKVLDIKKFND